ncbi:MAG TPA: GNAT family N-acetyltransferase [Polyangia bacterium]
MRADAQPTLVTERLRLRPLAPADAADVQRLAGRFEVAGTTANIPHPYPDGAAAAFIAAQADAWRDGSAATWAITRDGALLGCIGLALTARAHARASLGYWVAHGEWNRGYATEAARPVVAWALADGWHRVEATHLTRNPASGRVMQKLGMQREGCMRGYFRRFDKWEDVELYALVAE